CRFCQASQLYRPVRERPVEDILEIMDQVLSDTGWEKAGLLTLSLSDYSRLDELLQGLEEVASRHHAALSRPSMRPDTITRMGSDHEVTGRVTIAPEAGTEELRNRINKPMKDSAILESVHSIFRMGARGIKLYFIIGFPGETDEDVKAIGKLALRIAKIARESGLNPRKSVTVALSPFVPKAQTPLQWAPQMEESLVWNRIKQVRRICGRKVGVSWNSPRVALVEALLSLGDGAETADMLQEAVEMGARFDAWGDRFRLDIWKVVLGRHLELVDGLHQGIPLDAPLPWASLSTGVSEEFLKREYSRFQQGIPTPDCRKEECAGCGACRGAEDGS
ncbi:MAG: radical SAM protein, partial [Candidatus Aegiribacteria sp.]|nr:radical SAM protein [Candidatus Aegiribacteria sp.]MBD3294879.1 radical SAM protein [Candidatus Fermentibacteria bacterium]